MDIAIYLKDVKYAHKIASIIVIYLLPSVVIIDVIMANLVQIALMIVYAALMVKLWIQMADVPLIVTPEYPIVYGQELNVLALKHSFLIMEYVVTHDLKIVMEHPQAHIGMALNVFAHHNILIEARVDANIICGAVTDNVIMVKLVQLAFKIVELVLYHNAVMVIVIYILMKIVQLAHLIVAYVH
jgi:hypothetical protein